MKPGRFFYLTREPKMIIRAVAIALADLFVVAFSAFFSLWIRFDFTYKNIELKYIEAVAQMLPFTMLVTVLVFILFRLYRHSGKGRGTARIGRRRPRRAA